MENINLLKAINKIRNSFIGFFDTAPEIMSDNTAKRLRNPKEAQKLMREVQKRRVGKNEPHLEY